jgi:hypothetical protein
MNKQETIYRLFASRAAVLENNSQQKKTGKWVFERENHQSLMRAVEPNGTFHIVAARDIGSVAWAKLIESMIRDLGDTP